MRSEPISAEILRDLYVGKKLSMAEIAKRLRCSVHKVSYWMLAHNITTRSISEAVYLKANPNGDPFAFTSPKTLYEAELFGFGLGLYWGEGTKADKSSVRLGNTDAGLLEKFIVFLETIFHIERDDCHFGLQLFTDIPEDTALDFWAKKLRIKRRQFYKTIRTQSGSMGTYRKKSQYGVLTVYYHNKKLRDLIVSLLPM